MELGNLLLQGKNSSGAPTRMKVPMRGKEAEQSVVAMNSAKAEGAKRLYCTALIAGQPREIGLMCRMKTTREETTNKAKLRDRCHEIV
jgi:hypothetical protein